MSATTIQIIEIVMGIISLIFSACSIIPQIISLRKTRNTSGMSLISFSIICFDNVLWLIWMFGFYFNSMLMNKEPMTRLFQISLLVLCFSYIFGSILVSYILIVKIKHVLKAKELKITELELSKILKDQDKKKFFVNNKWNNFNRYWWPITYIFIVTLIAFGVSAILYVFAYIQPVEGTKEWVWVMVFSFLSSGVWEISCWPQLIKSIKEKDTTGINLFWCVFAAVNCIETFAYDLSLSFNTGGFNWNVLFVLIFSAIIPNVGVMIIKIKNLSNAKKKGMSEVEYTKKILLPLVKQKKQQIASKKKNGN